RQCILSARMTGTRRQALVMFGSLTLVTASASGCARNVVRVATEPAGAEVTVNGDSNREQRWSVASDEPVALLARWPDGHQVAAEVYVDRDAKITLRRDGEPGQVVGARLADMAPAPG